MLEQPKNVVFVTPECSVLVDVLDAKPALMPQVIITEGPKYGSITFDPEKPLSFTYTCTIGEFKSTTVDKVTFTYKDTKEVTQMVTREFVLRQQGDVPRSIQTGPNSQSRCKPIRPKGTTVGTISVGNLEMPIKAFNYPAGGVMEPQKTTLAAGVSQRHMPLSAEIGTSVITWHVNYSGCWNPLNILTKKREGSIFTVTDENGESVRYRIDKKVVVRKGNYKKSWFTLVGPRQLTLVTCTGSFVDGHYKDNWVLIATPIS
jgi:sortase (surface protein transpeptidase)